MSVLKVLTYPDPRLREISKPVTQFDENLKKTAQDMLETMYDAPGIGLAANQVGVLKRMIVIDTDFDIEDMEDELKGIMPEARSASGPSTKIITNKNPRIIFNPEIVLREGEILFGEGCLSVPGYTADVKRSEKIKLQFQNVDGLTETLLADGILAVAIQHELDHLDGKLFIDRLSPLKKEMAKKKLIRERQQKKGRS